MSLKDRKAARDRNCFVQNGEEETEKGGSPREHPVSTGRAGARGGEAAVRRRDGKCAQPQCHVRRAAVLASVHPSV